MLSVIIPTCNRNNLLRQCLELLKPDVQSIDANAYEVIVTDDSKDGIAANLIQTNYAWAKWAKGPGKGPAANRNNGAKYAKGKWLVFVDDDCLPDKELIRRYNAGIKNNSGCLAFEGAIFPDNWELLKRDMAECPVNTRGGCFWSANICIHAKLFHELKGFNEAFLIAAQEDQEIYYRILQRTNVPFLKNCIVVHPVRYGKLNQKIRRIPIEINNWIIFSRRTRSWLQVLTDGSISQIKASVRTVKEGKIRSLLYHLTSLFYLIPGIIIYAFQDSSKQKV